MEFDKIPHDVWISIFEQVKDPSVLAILVRTCRCFHELASKPLLMELKWIKPDSTLRNLEAWKRVYGNLVALPRKVTIGVPFDHIKYPIFMLTPEMELHDSIHEKLLQFTSLTELVFNGTLISPYTYQILAFIPTLRSLRLLSCNVFGLQSSFRTRTSGNHIQQYSASNSTHQTGALGHITQFHAMSITHLSLHGCTIPLELESSPFHPLCLLTAPMLSSLSITWTANISARYAQNRWILPSLNELAVMLPLLSRDLLDELAGFIDRCPPSLRVRLKIEKHNLSDTQMATIQVPSKGLWSYEGPLAIIASSALKTRGSSTLTHVKVTETLELPPLLDGLAKFPKGIEALDIQVGRWDIEVLFAVRALFQGIKQLVVKYARGSFPSDLLVRMGADILFCLPELHTIRLLGPRPSDGSSVRCSATSGAISADGSGSHRNAHTQFPTHSPVSHPPVFYDMSDEGGHWATQGPTMLQFSQQGMDGLEIYDSYSSDKIPEGGPVHGGEFTNNLVYDHYRQYRLADTTWGAPSLSTPKPTRTSFGSPSGSLLFRVSPALSNKPRPLPPRRTSAFHPRSEPAKCDMPPLTSSQAELGDYLIGWSRYCRSLRVVQIDHQWWWERRFDGDRWTLQRVQEDEKIKRTEKGKERERSLFI